MLLHAPSAPFMLIQDWVKHAYRDLHRQHPWSWTRKESALRFRVSRSVTATVTQYSTTVTSAGAFVAADAGRQLRIGTYPIYTIATVVSVNEITLERAYEDATATGAVTILDAYPMLPLDFGEFLNVTNPYELRVIPWWVNQDYLDKIDPTRIQSGSLLRILAARTLGTVTSNLGRTLYEGWPTITVARSYPFLYKTRADEPNETTTFVGPLATASDVLELGALAHGSLWPGTREDPNPYFTPGLQDRLKREWEAAVQQLWLTDDAAFPLQVEQAQYRNLPPHSLSYPTETLRETDATIGDYL